jgi:hypothetical protein
MDSQRIIAVGLLTQKDLDLLGPTFSRAYPIDDTPCFDELLRAIDEADRTAGNQARKDWDLGR